MAVEASLAARPPLVPGTRVTHHPDAAALDASMAQWLSPSVKPSGAAPTAGAICNTPTRIAWTARRDVGLVQLIH